MTHPWDLANRPRVVGKHVPEAILRRLSARWWSHLLGQLGGEVDRGG